MEQKLDARGYAAPFGLLLPFLNQGFDFVDFLGKSREEAVTSRCHKYIVFDAHAKLLFGDVDARLNRDDHVGFKRTGRCSDVMDVESNVVAGSMDEIFSVAFGLDIALGSLMILLIVPTGLHFANPGLRA